MKCPNCNQEVEASAAFCGNCGHQLQAGAQPEQSATPATTDPASTAEQSVTPAATEMPTPARLDAPASQVPEVPMAPQTPSAPTAPQATPADAGAPMAPAASVAHAAASGVPAYAIGQAPDKSNKRLTLAIVLASISIPGALIPIVGFGLAIAALIITSHHKEANKNKATTARTLAIVGIVLSALAFSYNVSQLSKKQTGFSAGGSLTASVSVADNSVVLHAALLGK